jgi:hypothetical protein
MNPTSIPRGDGQARAVAGEQSSLHEARLWYRARLNLMLLYGGRRSGACNGQGGVKNGVSSSFGSGDLKISDGTSPPGLARVQSRDLSHRHHRVETEEFASTVERLLAENATASR